ncbi:hypothetical protein CEXT_269941 [Caerostris extrusa]|uniref:Uncharacterized protein n=1 Tax=Caerostris extrusa TaxID=172846 RepID=A0AAV4P3K0_CAEEX|nr:hypothetical protein CEXT_269941 [Caerostris extrusa]
MVNGLFFLFFRGFIGLPEMKGNFVIESDYLLLVNTTLEIGCPAEENDFFWFMVAGSPGKCSMYNFRRRRRIPPKKLRKCSDFLDLGICHIFNRDISLQGIPNSFCGMIPLYWQSSRLPRP